MSREKLFRSLRLHEAYCALKKQSMMKSVKPFFTPAAKKVKHCEGETPPTAEGEGIGETSMRRSALSDKEHLSDSTLYCDANMSANRPLQQEQGEEQSSIAGCCERDNHCDFQIDPSLQEPLFTSPSVVGRRWHKLRARKCHYQQKSQNFGFTVVSYNVLADGLLHANSHLYSGTESWVQQWEYRRRNLLQEILHYNADIVCLQEVENCHYQDWFEPKLRERGYTGVYKKRTGDKTDGCATFFKKSSFTLVKSKLVSFRKPGIKLMDRDNVAVVLLLKPRTSRRSNNLVCVSNTHLLFNKKRGDIKLAQLSCLFAEIGEVAQTSSSDQGDCCYHPIVCCGDFNSTPYSPIYDFVIRGFLDYNGMHRDNFSGQSYYRRSYPPHHALTNNVIPWELGITPSCVKRNDASETTESLSLSSSSVEQPLGSTRNCATSSELCHPARSVLKKSKGILSGERNVENFESQGLPGSPQCTGKQDTQLQLAHCSSSIPKTCTSTETEPLNSLHNDGVHQEGEQISSQSAMDMTERDVYNTITVQQHNFKFFSVYRHYFANRRPEVTTFHDKACLTVDYMFVSPGLQRHCRGCRSQHGPLQLTGNLELLTEGDILCLGGLPNRFLSSDHLSLVSSFLLRL